MSVRVEFFGLARKAAAIEFLDVEAPNLGAAIEVTANQIPHLAEYCFNGNRLKNGFIANINASRFTTDPNEKLQDGDSVLIMSADAGG